MAYRRFEDEQDRPTLPQVPTPRPPMPAAPAAPATPAPTATAGGTGSDAAVAEANAAYNAGQRGSDPNAIFGPGGETALRQQFQTGGGPEDAARFSGQVLAQWEQYRVPGGGRPKYRSMRGEPGLFDKPTECREGWVPSGPSETAPCRQMTAAEGGAGGGGAGGGGGAAGAGGGAGMDAASSEIWNAILGRLKGGTRYTPEVMASLMGQVKTSAEAGATNARREALADAAARGMARSPADVRAGGAALRDIRAQASGQVLQAKNALNMAKINADYEDRNAAIQEGLEWLNSLRSYVAAMAGTEAQKQAAMANITLGYTRLNQEMDQLREGHAQRLQMAQLGF